MASSATHSVVWLGILFSLSLCFQLSVPLIPRWLDRTFPLHYVMTWHELLDVGALPFVCLSSFLLLNNLLHEREKVYWFAAYLLGLVIACEGHGIHVASNRIHSYISPGNEWHPTSSELQRTVYILDETIGHSTMFSGWIFIFLLLIIADESKAKVYRSNSFGVVVLLFFSFVQGVGWFFAAVEGQYAIPALTCCVIGILSSFRLFGAIRTNLISFYFHFSCAICLLLLFSWGLYFSWTWPEFRILGLGPFSSWIPKLLFTLSQMFHS